MARFGIANSIMGEVRGCTPDALHKAMDDSRTVETARKIRELRQQLEDGLILEKQYKQWKNNLKKKLYIITPHAMFPNGKRHNDDAVPSGLVMYDVDDLGDITAEDWYYKNIHKREKELGVVFASKTPGFGVRVIFEIPEGIMKSVESGEVKAENAIPEAQKWLSEQLTDKAYDEGCKDWARCSYVAPSDYILYLDEEGLFREVERGKLKVESEPQQPTTTHQPTTERRFKGMLYSDIIKEWFRQTGGEPVEGERNTRLYQLATHLRYICDDKEDLMLEIIPRYGLEEAEVKALISSALKARRNYMPWKMIDTLNAVESTKLKAESDPQQPSTTRQSSTDEDDVPPKMPENLPPLIELLTRHTPEIYKPAVANAVFAPLATHLAGVTFPYIDGKLHEGTMMHVLMAGSGAGKDCITDPIDYIMADIRERDMANRQREKEWKDDVNSKGANKDKNLRPKICIQEVMPDMTNPAFVMRTKEADGKFLYSKINEIDQFNALRGSRGNNNQFQIMCLAFDYNNHYGQDRVGTQSVTECVTVRWNWNAATTVGKGRRYFSQVLLDGPISRINFSTIPEQPIGADIPKYGQYEDDFAEQLKPYLQNLLNAKGMLFIPEANELADKMRISNADTACQTQSREYENLSFRANVIAWLKACILYVAHGGVWRKEIEDFVRWSLADDMWCKMHFFGEDIRKANEELDSVVRIYRNNILNSLPSVFSLSDASRAREAAGKNPNDVKNMIKQWVFRGYIKRLPDGSFQKN